MRPLAFRGAVPDPSWGRDGWPPWFLSHTGVSEPVAGSTARPRVSRAR